MTPLEQPSPYSPGFGAAPDPLYGRVDVIDRVDQAIRSVDWGVAGEAIRLTGLRGVGKTSLLREVERRVTDPNRLGQVLGRAKPKPWVVIRGEAGGDLLGSFAHQIALVGRELDRRRRWDVTVGISAVGVASASASRRPIEAGGVQVGLVELATTAARRRRRVVLLVDELHEADTGSLKAVTAAVNQLNGTNHPALLITAELPGRLDTSAITYFRDRSIEVSVGYLAVGAAEAALRSPAAARGVSWTPEAVEMVLAAASGYPYALQLMARETWVCAAEGNVIGTSAALRGVERGRLELAQMYQRRWNDLADRARRYLTVLAHLEEPGTGAVRSGAVARALGGTTPDWSRTRAGLIDAGAVIASDQALRIALPGWGRWILEAAGSNILDEATTERLS